MRRPPTLLLALLPLAAACIQDVGAGPYMGECARPPEGSYTFGEIGIGTCLSGPTDIAFFEQDGTTWMAVTNADPFRNFASGSLLLIDWEAVAKDRDTNYVDEIGFAVDTDPYVGGVGYVADEFKEVLLVTGRLSEDARTRSAEDEMFVFDVSDPTTPEPWSLGDKLTLRDDPQPLAIHDGFGRAYVANLTDHSISVLDTTSAPIVPLDLAPRAELGAEVFDDADASGSTAELALTLLDAENIPDDYWTMEWVEATFRVWLPSDSGLHRFTSGGSGYFDSGSTEEIDPALSSGRISAVSDPFYTSDLGLPEMLFGNDGDIWWIAQQASGVWAWSTLGRLIAGGPDGEWDNRIDAPSVLAVGETEALLVYYDARSSDAADASIGLFAFDASGSGARLPDPVLAPTAPYTSFEQPWVRTDLLTQRHRMWLSMWDGAKWTIGLSQSEDTVTWSAPVEVMSHATDQMAAPVVSYANGRFRLWFTHGDGVAWHLAESWSYDGVTWSDPVDVLDVATAYDPRHPPRVALFADATGGWTLEGEALGEFGGLVYASSPYIATGFSIRAASGYEVGPDVLGAPTAHGVVPVSRVDWGGHDYLYVTTTDASDDAGIGLLERSGDTWVGVAGDLVPPGTGGNDDGASSPVVVAQGGGLAMYYAAHDADGVPHLRRATSTDGVAWAPSDLDVPAHDDWEVLGRRPHSVEALSGGGVRLWYSAADDAVSRIGSLVSDDGVAFDAEPGDLDPWQLGVGPVGRFDDSGVADPAVVVSGDTTHLWYAAFDGEVWAVGHATRKAGDTSWVREEDTVTGLAVPKLFGVSRTFSAFGVRSLVMTEVEGGFDVLYGGFDGATWRVGRAIGDGASLFPAQRFPTPGDSIAFETLRGDPIGGVIELQQRFDGYTTTGLGVSAMRLDAERGFLYVVAKRIERVENSFVYIIDVRDDTRDGFADRNYLDIEAILKVGPAPYASGFRDVAFVPGTDLLYASGHAPDAIVVFDLSLVVDDDQKDVIDEAALAAMPLRRVPSGTIGRPFQDEDAGEASQQRISGAGIALSPDGDTLYVTHFRQNSLLAYDLRLGAYGELVRATPYLGENPHLVRISPDGRYAVVANYLGETDDNVVRSTLAVVDIDPASPDYMQVVTWIRNL